MFCHKCGNKLSDEADFCRKCGTKIVVEDTKHQTSEPSTDNSGIDKTRSIRQIFDYIGTGDFANSEMLIADYLKSNESSAEIYLAKLFIEMKVKNADELKKVTEPISEKENYKEAVRLSNEVSRAKLIRISNSINQTIEEKTAKNANELQDINEVLHSAISDSINKSTEETNDNLMFCHKCGTKAVNEIAFCHKCGAKLFKDKSENSTDSVPETTITDTEDKNLTGIKEPYNKQFQYLSAIGGVVYCILFFFPWIKVIGQNWLASFGYGNKDGFNPIGLLWFVINFILNLLNIFGNFIEIESVDITVIIAIIIFFAILIAPIRSAWRNIKNLLCLISTPDNGTIYDTSMGPIIFIVSYYLARSAIQSYIADVTSYDWLGNIAGNVYGTFIELSAIPFILAILGFINCYLAKKYVRSKE